MSINYTRSFHNLAKNIDLMVVELLQWKIFRSEYPTVWLSQLKYPLEESAYSDIVIKRKRSITYSKWTSGPIINFQNVSLYKRSWRRLPSYRDAVVFGTAVFRDNRRWSGGWKNKEKGSALNSSNLSKRFPLFAKRISSLSARYIMNFYDTPERWI